MLCRPHPLRGATPQRFLISSIYIPRRKSQRGIQPVLYPVCWFTVSALINGFRRCATASVTESAQADAERFSRCHRQNVPELLRFQNRCAIGYAPSRSGLCTVALPVCQLSIAFPTPGFHRWERPSMCPQPDLNRHTKALAIELQGHVRLAVCTTIVIICEVYRARSHRQVATLPSGTAHRSCTFAAPLFRNAAPLPL